MTIIDGSTAANSVHVLTDEMPYNSALVSSSLASSLASSCYGLVFGLVFGFSVRVWGLGLGLGLPWRPQPPFPQLAPPPPFGK